MTICYCIVGEKIIDDLDTLLVTIKKLISIAGVFGNVKSPSSVLFAYLSQIEVSGACCHGGMATAIVFHALHSANSQCYRMNIHGMPDAYQISLWPLNL